MTKISNRTKYILAAPLFLIASLVLGLANVQFASAATRGWTGAGNGTSFSDAANWGGVAPVAGDVLSFGVIGSGSFPQYTLNNDLDLAFGGISYGDSSKTDAIVTGYTISDLILADNATITKFGSSNNPTYENASITVSGAFQVGAHLTVNGYYPYIKRPASDLDVAVANLTITGTGLPTIDQSNVGVGYTPYKIYFKPTTVTINTGSQWLLDGTTPTTVNVQNGARVVMDTDLTTAANFNFGTSSAGSASIATRKNASLTGNIALNGDAYYYVYGSKTLTLSGVLSGTGSFKMATGSTGTFINNTTTNSTSTPAGPQEVPVTEQPPITDNQPGTDVIVEPKTSVEIDGTRGDIEVRDSGTVKGSGTVDSLTVNEDGRSSGNLTVLTNVYMNGVLAPNVLNSSSYDQLKVGANYSGGGNAVALGNSAALQVNLSDGWSIKQGDQFTLIDNLSSTAVSGTFNGLAEGAQFTVEGITFSITYVGGTGNDIVITALNTGTDPNAPNTGAAKLLLGNPVLLASLGAVTVGLLATLALRRKTSR